PDCQPQQFQCKSDGECVLESERCDGQIHCHDASDEHNCWECHPRDYFQCIYDHACIPAFTRCDGKVDCLDGTDETVCGDDDDDNVLMMA
ncbi:hypothetical protein Pcinc_037720, partial [Petrolisthes cinctipes]